MKKIIILLLVVCLLSSCATMFNSKYHNVEFSASVLTKIIVDADTIDIDITRNPNSIWSNTTSVKMERSNQEKEVVVLRGKYVDTIMLRPNSSPAYAIGNSATFGIGFIFDRKTSKRWSYNENWSLKYNRIHLDNDYIIAHHPTYPQRLAEYRASDEYRNRYSHKGAVNFRLGVPWFNWSNFDFEGYGKIAKLRYFGLSAGLNYFYADNAFLSLSASAYINSFFPFPVASDPQWGNYEDWLSSYYASISNNHKIWKFSLGYGISFGRDVWNTIYWALRDGTESDGESTYRGANSLGLIFPVFYNAVNSGFYYGVVYRPMFVQFGDNIRYKYQHTISIELGWRFRLAK